MVGKYFLYQRRSRLVAAHLDAQIFLERNVKDASMSCIRPEDINAVPQPLSQFPYILWLETTAAFLLEFFPERSYRLCFLLMLTKDPVHHLQIFFHASIGDMLYAQTLWCMSLQVCLHLEQTLYLPPPLPGK